MYVQISFTSFTLESGYDYLKLHDGWKKASAIEYGPLSGHIPPDLQSRSYSVFIEFITNAPQTFTGLHLNNYFGMRYKFDISFIRYLLVSKSCENIERKQGWTDQEDSIVLRKSYTISHLCNYFE